MANEVKAFIAALRAGKSSRQAANDYCWARLVVPCLSPEAWQVRYHQPMPAEMRRWHCEFPPTAEEMAVDAFNKGEDDDTIAAAFDAGLGRDYRDGYRFRVMERDERPTFADQIRAMPMDEQMKATKFFGVRQVAEAVAGRP